jgi:bacteriocin resistance YdeI/OmpD-like protein/uncharacterized protein DUF1905
MNTELRTADATICFTAELPQPDLSGETWYYLPLPDEARLSCRDETMVEGTLECFPFRANLEPTDRESHRIRLHRATCHAAVSGNAKKVRVELTRVGEEPETRVPIELLEALSATPAAHACWLDIKPMSRRDWTLWIITAKQAKTRQSRIQKACDMLSSGKRRVCCFGGLNWLTKDHPIETWVQLPKLS